MVTYDHCLLCQIGRKHIKSARGPSGPQVRHPPKSLRSPACSARLAPTLRYSDNVLGTQTFKCCSSETQRSSGENYVTDCTQPDDVEPTRRRLIQPAGWVGSIFQLN